MTLDVLEHHQEYFPVHDCEMNYSYMDFEPYKDEKLVVDDLLDEHNLVLDVHILDELVEVVAYDHSNMVVPCEDHIHQFVAVPFDSVELVAVGAVAIVALWLVAFAVVDMLVELVVAVNIVDFVAFVGVVVVEYFVAVDLLAENFVATNIAETVMVPFVEPVTFVAVTSVAVT